MDIYLIQIAFAVASFLADDSRVHLGRSMEGGLSVNFMGSHSMPGVALHSIYDRNASEYGRIYMDPISPFTMVVSRFMILYHERSLVIRPTSPESLCYLGQISYTESLSPEKYSVYARVGIHSLTDDVVPETITSDSDMEFTIDFSSAFDLVPNRILDGIQDAISDLLPIGFSRSYQHSGFGFVPSTRSFRFVCGNDPMLDHLPIVQYTILSSSRPSEALALIRLYPRDYLEVDISSSVCKSKIRSLVDVPANQSDAIFGMPFISTVALHIDISNGIRIGFGEPI